MRKVVTLILCCFLGPLAAAQDESVLKAAQYLSGAVTPEEVDESWIERLEGAGKVRVNASHLRPGILSDYQIASLADYRARSGDVLSWEELALVDGFSREMVEILRPFLSLESTRLPGAADTTRIRVQALLRSTLSSTGGKARISGDGWRVGATRREKDGTYSAEAELGRHRFLLGHYNLRLGQGLACWTGFSMSSLSSVDAFVKRATGAAPVWSYNSGNVPLGAVHEYAGGRWRAMGFAAKGQYGAHADYLYRQGQMGLTAAYGDGLVLSLDGRYNHRGTDYAFEAAYKNQTLGALASARWKAGDAFRLAVQSRVLPSRFSGKKYGEYALALGAAYKAGRWQPLAGKTGFGSSVPAHQASLTLDAALLPLPGTDPSRLQIRAYANWDWQMSPALTLSVRFTERYRNYERPRSDIRSDLRYGYGPWSGTWRTEGVHCEGWGFLSYLEGGFKGERLTAYLRFTGFSIGLWNDRIYCYERDAPGTFSVPAYSGEGLSASLTAGYKLRLRRITFKAYLRAAYLLRKGRDSAPTLNFQLQCER